jgi:hypothetical protein
LPWAAKDETISLSIPDKRRGRAIEEGGVMEYSQQAADLLQGAFDLHVHTAPSFFPRSLTAPELAENLERAGMAGAVIKTHEGDCSGQAEVATLFVGGQVKVYGSVTLNVFVGGINPYAVEAAAILGVKIVYMPTISARNHLRVFGAATFPDMPGAKIPHDPKEPLTVLDAVGRLIPPIYEIFDIVKEHNIVLATGHLDNTESMLLCREARRCGVAKVLFTHPDFVTSRLDMDRKRELAGMGVLLERTCLGFDAGEAAAGIRELGARNWVLSSDFGQIHNPPPDIGLGRVIDELLGQGVSAEDIRLMVRDTPAHLVGG